jgi:group I intron endonuclease
MKSGIYKITNPENQYFYIGSSYDINNRWRKHLERLTKGNHPNIHLQRAYNKKSIDFLLTVVEYCSISELIEKEQYYIDTLLPQYNICKVAGSSLGVVRREETKQLLRDINLGKTQSKETIEKRRQKLIGKKRTDDVKKILSENQKGKNNSLIKSGVGFDKQIEAMKKANTGKKRDKSVGEKIAKKLSKPVLQFDLNNNFIKEWESANKVERELGFSNSLINRVCSGKKNSQGAVAKTAYGYKWKFKN